MDGPSKPSRQPISHTTVPHIFVGEGLQNQPSGFGVPALSGLQAQAPKSSSKTGKGLTPTLEHCQSEIRPDSAVQRRVVTLGVPGRRPFSSQEPGGEKSESFSGS